VLTERNGFDGPELGLEASVGVEEVLSKRIFKLDRMAELLVNQGCMMHWFAGEDPRRIAQELAGRCGENFQRMRQRNIDSISKPRGGSPRLRNEGPRGLLLVFSGLIFGFGIFLWGCLCAL